MKDEEIKDFLASYDGHWVIVGEYNELVNVIENEVFKKFEALSWIIEDDKLYSAQNAYLLKQNLKRFDNHQELDEYLKKLTKEKYEQP